MLNENHYQITMSLKSVITDLLFEEIIPWDFSTTNFNKLKICGALHVLKSSIHKYIYIYTHIHIRMHGISLNIFNSIILYWPTVSEADGGMAAEVEPSPQYSTEFCFCATDCSRRAFWQNGFWHGSAYETKVQNWITSCGKKKKWNPLTFTGTYWTFMKTKQWT